MPRFKLKFDEFFKLMSKGFFPLLGYEVQTEVEIFKLPKKMDVLVLHTNKVDAEQIKAEFSIFDYFTDHNIISFKSLNDKIASENDILDLVTYTSGYIRSSKIVTLKNTSATLLTSRLSKNFWHKNQGVEQVSKCHFILDLNLFKLHVIDLSNLELKGMDSYFLTGYAPSEFLIPLSKLLRSKKKKPKQKIIDKLTEMLYIRIRSFEDEEIWEDIMPTTMEADITEMVLPYYEKGIEKGLEKGRLEGKLEVARGMFNTGSKLEFVIKTTGLTKAELKKAGLVK